jgi:hypothetical protein
MRFAAIALTIVAAIPALADSRFRIAIMPRPALAAGAGQCDIRIEVDNDVQVTIRRDQVAIYNVSGEDARDDGSDCSVALPAAELHNFAIQPLDGRSEIHLLEQPSARNDYAVVVHIVDAAAGFGRYRFRLSWDASPAATATSLRDQSDNDRPHAPDAFVWNNATTYHGRGGGETVLNDGAAERLGDARVDVDLGGNIVVSFTPVGRRARGGRRSISFSGTVMTRQGSRIRASVVTENERLRGTMNISVDEKNTVNSITMNATDGQDHLHLRWDRR